MHISRVRVRNFRSFRNAELRFTKGVNTLIGENGSGKTNAFQAIRLLLDDSLARSATRLSESDFNRSLTSWRGHWIIISIDFDELDSSEGCQILRHNIGHMEGSHQGTYTFYFRPNKEVRKSLHELTASGGTEDDFAAIAKDITLDQYEAQFTGRATLNVCDDQSYSKVAGDFETLVFPDPDEDDAEVLGTRVTQPLHFEVSCTFVKALRDVVADLRNYRDSPLLNLLRDTERRIAIGDSTSILAQVATLNSQISGLDEIRKIASGIQDSLHDTAGYAYSPTVDIQSAIPDELDRLLQRLALRVSDPGDEGYKGEIDELSLGGANLIYLSLKLLEYELKTASDKVAHFLLIEEPESHIHTHIQKTLFEKYSYDSTQVVVSTHSTHISAASRIRSVNILAKDSRCVQVYHPANGLDNDQCNRIERYLDAVRTTLLFAKGVILVEGDAELVLIPALVRSALGISLDELGVSLISMSSTVFGNLAMLFDDARIRRRCAIVTDLDASIITLPSDTKTDDEFQRKCRNSAIAGAARKIALDQACAGNVWAKPFYATHTFEVNFIGAGNVAEIISALDDIYTKPNEKSESASKLNGPDVAIYGKEILRLAKKQGKGWLAVLLAEKIGPQTIIPDYVLDAVAFACSMTIDRKCIRQMASHRCDKVHPEQIKRARIKSLIASGTPDDLHREYVSKYPDDVLSKFIERTK